jgi:hypothetical protein
LSKFAESAMASMPSVPVLENVERTDADDSDSVRDVCTTFSPISESSQPAVIKRDKDVVRRKHENPRALKKKDHHNDFIILCCDGRQEHSKEMIEKFKKLDQGNKASKELATEMLGTFYEMGAKERMLRDVFGIGSTRYQRVVSGKPARVGGGKNVNAVNESMIASISEMVAQLPTGNGEPCEHGRTISYCTDPNINTWMKLFRYYENFLNGKDIRKMGFSTFFNYVKSCHPDLRLTRLDEDVCECCSHLQVGGVGGIAPRPTAKKREKKREASSVAVAVNDTETEETTTTHGQSNAVNNNNSNSNSNMKFSRKRRC